MVTPGFAASGTDAELRLEDDTVDVGQGSSEDFLVLDVVTTEGETFSISPEIVPYSTAFSAYSFQITKPSTIIIDYLTDHDYRQSVNTNVFNYSSFPSVSRELWRHSRGLDSTYIYTLYSSGFPLQFKVNINGLTGINIQSISLRGSFTTYVKVTGMEYGRTVTWYPSSAALIITPDVGNQINLAFSCSNTSVSASSVMSNIGIDGKVSDIYISCFITPSNPWSSSAYSYHCDDVFVGTFYLYPGSFSGSYEKLLTFQETVQRDLGLILEELRTGQILQAIRTLGTTVSKGFSDVLSEIRSGNSTLNTILAMLSTVLSAIQDISGNQFSPPPEQSAAANQYKDDMQQSLDKIDESNKIIEDNTNRPSADSIVPSAPPIIQDGKIGGNDAAAVSMVEGIGDVLAFPMILSNLVLVFSIAFLSYVLFGKKE